MLSIPYSNFSGVFSGSFFIGSNKNYSVNTPSVPNFILDIIVLVKFLISNINNKDTLRDMMDQMIEYIDSNQSSTVLTDVKTIISLYLNGSATKKETLSSLKTLLGEDNTPDILTSNNRRLQGNRRSYDRHLQNNRKSQDHTKFLANKHLNNSYLQDQCYDSIKLPTSIKNLKLLPSTWPEIPTQQTSNVDISVPSIIPSINGSTASGLIINRNGQQNQSLFNVVFSGYNQITTDQKLLGQLVMNGTLAEQGQIQQQILDTTVINVQTTGKGGLKPVVNANRFPILIPSIASLSAGLPIPTSVDSNEYKNYKNNIQNAQNNYMSDVQFYGQPIAMSTYYNDVQYYVLQYWINTYTTAGNTLIKDQQEAYTNYITSRTIAYSKMQSDVASGTNVYVARAQYNVSVNSAFIICIPYFQNMDFSHISIYPIITFTPSVLGKYIKLTFSTSLSNLIAESTSFELDASKLSPLICNAYRRILKSSIIDQNTLVNKTRISNILSTGPSPHQIWNTIITWVYSYSALAAYSWSYNTLGFKFPLPKKNRHRTLNFIFEENYLSKINNILNNVTNTNGLDNWITISSPDKWTSLIYGNNDNIVDSDSEDTEDVDSEDTEDVDSEC